MMGRFGVFASVHLDEDKTNDVSDLVIPLLDNSYDSGRHLAF